MVKSSGGTIRSAVFVAAAFSDGSPEGEKSAQAMIKTFFDRVNTGMEAMMGEDMKVIEASPAVLKIENKSENSGKEK